MCIQKNQTGNLTYISIDASAFVDGERPGMIQSQYEADKHSAVKCVTGYCRIALRLFSGLGEEAL